MKSPMPNPKAAHLPEFRRQLVELIRSGRSPEDLSKQYQSTAQAIRNWVRQSDLDEGRRADGLTTAEREELHRLRRENRVLREERDIPQKRSKSRSRRISVCE